MRVGVVRLEVKRGAVFGDGPIQVTFLVKREAEANVRRCVTRLEALG